MHEYDSYDYAYLMVSYLIDNYGKNYLIQLLCDKNKLDLASRNLLDNSIKYYNDKFFGKGSDLHAPKSR